jgi:hypothetical protein
MLKQADCRLTRNCGKYCQGSWQQGNGEDARAISRRPRKNDGEAQTSLENGLVNEGITSILLSRNAKSTNVQLIARPSGNSLPLVTLEKRPASMVF